MRALVAVSACTLVLSGPAFAQDAGHVTNPDKMKWSAAPPFLPKGAQLVVLSGDPAKEGIFTVRLKFPANYKVPPHTHPTDELITVIDGDFAAGMGEKLDAKAAAKVAEGGFVQMPAKMAHFAMSQSGAIIQINGMGPLKIDYIDPKDGPSK
ncbi:cupin domain-containing protein [Alsobacter sp. SYSU BS001988]